MAAQTVLNPTIQSRYDMIQQFEQGTSRLSFDVQKRQWVFTARINAKIAKTASKMIIKNTLLMSAFKGASHGAVGGIISLGRVFMEWCFMWRFINCKNYRSSRKRIL